MLEIKGKVNTAICYASVIEDEACHYVPSGMHVWQGRRGEIQNALKQLANTKVAKSASMPDDLCYLYGEYFEDYLADVEICQHFAKRNRELIAEIILGRCGLTANEAFHTSSVNEDTLDEAPMAYKSLHDIIDVIAESVEVIEVLKPIYNFKAS